MALPPILSLLCLLGFCCLVLVAALSDIRSLTIPNRLSLAIALLYPAFVLSSAAPIDWIGGLAVGGAILVVGIVLFSMGVLGGGDAKLMAACGLWAGPALLVPYLFMTAMAGGCMALFFWLRSRLSTSVFPLLGTTTIVDEDLAKKPLPYAVAIATGALYVAFTILSVG